MSHEDVPLSEEALDAVAGGNLSISNATKPPSTTKTSSTTTTKGIEGSTTTTTTSPTSPTPTSTSTPKTSSFDPSGVKF